MRLPLYLATAGLARFADDGVAIAVPLLALQRTGSAVQSAGVLAAWMAPHALAAPLTGALAARARRGAFHAVALGVFAASIAGLALTVGRAPAAVGLGIAVAGGSCGPVVTGGMSSLLAALVPSPEGRGRAYALDAATYNAASIAGPAAVTVAAGLWTADAATGLLAAAAAGAAVLATALRTAAPARGRTPRAGLRADLVAGLAALWRIRPLRAVTAATSCAFVGVGGLTLTAVLLAEDQGYPGGGGLLMTLFAVGALAGSLALARGRWGISDGRLAGACLVGTGLALGGAAAVPSFPAVAAFFVAAGLCDGPLLAATLRIRADCAPPDAHAQVFTLGAGLKVSAAAAGAALTGAAAAAVGPAGLLGAVAGLQLAAAALLAALSREGRPPARARTSPPAPHGTLTP